MTDQYSKQLAQTIGLIRLQKIKQSRAMRKLKESLHKKAKAESSFKSRQQAIAELKKDLTSFKEPLTESTVARSFVDRRSYWLNYDLEREEFYLPIEQRDLEQAMAEFKNATGSLKKEQLKEDHFLHKLKADKANVEEAIEYQSDLESISNSYVPRNSYD